MKILHLYISFLNYLNIICEKDKLISLSHLSFAYLNYYIQPLESNFDEIFSVISQKQNLYLNEKMLAKNADNH